ncbi:MAG: precorrin-3B synthase [Actinomycetota bacterium]|nr:precorrin-3B synthase [Actinomycetota bacterium]
MSEPDRRTTTDRCPGVLRTHAAADGAVARIRLPGGRLRPDQLQRLAQVAGDHADGFLELTARANLQIRGISDVDKVAAAVVEAGLAPSSAHDRIRNIEVSPLTGRIGGVADVSPLADALDDRLRADAHITNLSGRFLFGIDDGRGDVLARRPDVCAVAREVEPPDAPPDDRSPDHPIVADVVVDGVRLGSARGVEAIATAMCDTALDLLEIDPTAWRVADLADEQRARLESGVRARLTPAVGAALVAEPTAPIVGWFEQDDGRVLLGAVVELARLPARLAEFLAAVDAPIVLTPDREILLCDLGEGVAETVVRVLAPMGLIFDSSSPWVRVTCCVGAPGCAKSHAPVRDDLLFRVRCGDPVADREHWVGCSRGCGSPAGPHRFVQAGPDGEYRSARR